MNQLGTEISSCMYSLCDIVFCLSNIGIDLISGSFFGELKQSDIHLMSNFDLFSGFLSMGVYFHIQTLLYLIDSLLYLALLSERSVTFLESWTFAYAI